MKRPRQEEMTQQIATLLEEMVHSDAEKDIRQLADDQLMIKTQTYRLVDNYRDGFELDAFVARYQDFFDKYDFIVGDWAAKQLRLRGMYQINYRKATREQTIECLQDYLTEYCNFGCAYFVLAKESALAKYDKLRKIVGQGSIQHSNEPMSHRRVNTKEQHFGSKRSNNVSISEKYEKLYGDDPKYARKDSRKPSFKKKKRQTEKKQSTSVATNKSSQKGNFVIKQKKG